MELCFLSHTHTCTYAHTDTFKYLPQIVLLNIFWSVKNSILEELVPAFFSESMVLFFFICNFRMFREYDKMGRVNTTQQINSRFA